MIRFHVDDMTCGHCVAAITQAVQAADAGAQLRFDLPAHQVDIEASRLNAGALAGLLREAGYTPQEMAAPVAASAATGGSCGGGCGCAGRA